MSAILSVLRCNGSFLQPGRKLTGVPWDGRFWIVLATFLAALIKYNSREEGLIQIYSWKIQSIMVGKAAGHMAFTDRKQRETGECWC